MTDAEGLTTTYTYDALGRTIAETRPGFCGALLVTSNEYNTANQLVATRTYVLNENSTPTPVAGMRCCRVARGSGTGEYVEVNMSLRMAAELKSGRRPRGTRLAAMVVFV